LRDGIHELSFSPMRWIAAVSAFLVMSGCEGARQTQMTQTEGSSILRLDPALDAVVPRSAEVEKLAGGFQFVEGPLWFKAGHLWFSDVTGNVVRQWSPDGVIEILRPGGYDANDAPAGGFIGPNAMVHGQNGVVLLCQHGNRRIVTISQDRKISVLVDRYNGKRLNSPNDLVYKPDGALYFTDPPYGFAKLDEDPKKELKFNGVFRLAHGELKPIIEDLTRPNGIAFSPDEKYLYVSNSDEKHKVWMKYDVSPDGSVSNGRVFFDVTAETAAGLPDGMKIDARGNLFCAGPGGLWIFSSDGKHLGTIRMPEVTSNCNWGDDGKSLYITASTGLYRIKLAVEGEKALYN
jgi:gluconolactonase